jgi:hypothetical protein
MNYRISKFPSAFTTHKPANWVVEAIAADGEKSPDSAMFSGPNAETAAQEYAAWKNGPTAACPACANRQRLAATVLATAQNPMVAVAREPVTSGQ